MTLPSSSEVKPSFQGSAYENLSSEDLKDLQEIAKAPKMTMCRLRAMFGDLSLEGQIDLLNPDIVLPRDVIDAYRHLLMMSRL